MRIYTHYEGNLTVTQNQVLDEDICKKISDFYEHSDGECCWTLDENRSFIITDTKFHASNAVDWITYIYENVVKPEGYDLYGSMNWVCYENNKCGSFMINNIDQKIEQHVSNYYNVKDFKRNEYNL